jgi:hypothetical protein
MSSSTKPTLQSTAVQQPVKQTGYSGWVKPASEQIDSSSGSGFQSQSKGQSFQPGTCAFGPSTSHQFPMMQGGGDTFSQRTDDGYYETFELD